jgi:hypothetical protein
MHQDEPMHDTPISETLVWPVGLGLGTIVQAAPFHSSVKLVAPPMVPTAMQLLDEEHEIPLT